jgi:hypothetical protein
MNFHSVSFNTTVCSFRSFTICCKCSIRISTIRYNVKFEVSEMYTSCQPHCRLLQNISNKVKECDTSCLVQYCGDCLLHF